MQDPTLDALAKSTNNFTQPNTALIIYLVRKFLRDNPKLNAVFKKIENDDDDIKLAMNLALADWNGTPPLIAPVSVVNFPKPDWLVVCTAMFLLESAGVLHYRNELSYNDSGISVNPWSKGPQYFGTADLWARRLDAAKREFKYALNIAQTWGVVRSPEYLIWDWSGLYTGPQYDNRSGAYTVLAGTGAGTPAPASSFAPLSTGPFNFGIATWEADPANSEYYINFEHNLAVQIDIRVLSPDGEDYKNKLKSIKHSENVVKIAVTMSPDSRFAGSIIAYKI